VSRTGKFRNRQLSIVIGHADLPSIGLTNIDPYMVVALDIDRPAAGFLASPVTAVSPGARKINALAQRSLGDKRNGRLGLFGVNQKHFAVPHPSSWVSY
jgi:hypothetical protein